jgi:hypothetical protein
MAGALEWYSVPAVARMLGISERAVRGRINRGSLAAEIAGGQWRIPLTALPEQKPEGGMSRGMSRGTSGGMWDGEGGMGGISDGTDTVALIDARQQAQADAVLQRVLAPFIEQLAETNQELGRVRAERDAAIAERDRLQAAHDALMMTMQQQPSRATDGLPDERPDLPEPAPPSPGLWSRLFGDRSRKNAAA